MTRAWAQCSARRCSGNRRGRGVVRTRKRSFLNADELQAHDSADGSPDPFGGIFYFPLAEMGVAQRHAHIGMAKHARDDRYGDAVHDRVARMRVAQIVKARVPQSTYARIFHQNSSSRVPPGGFFARDPGNTQRFVPSSGSRMFRAGCDNQTVLGPILLAGRKRCLRGSRTSGESESLLQHPVRRRRRTAASRVADTGFVAREARRDYRIAVGETFRRRSMTTSYAHQVCKVFPDALGRCLDFAVSHMGVT